MKRGGSDSASHRFSLIVSFWPEQYRRAAELSIIFLFKENQVCFDWFGRPSGRMRLICPPSERSFELRASGSVGGRGRRLRKQKERLQCDTKFRHTIVSSVNYCGKLVIRPSSEIYLTRFITAMCPGFVRVPETTSPKNRQLRQRSGLVVVGLRRRSQGLVTIDF